MGEMQVVMKGGKTMPETEADVARLMGQLADGEIHPLRDTRRAIVRWALARAEGNVSQAAQMLQISRGTIYRYARF
jgi:transcriptional regulator of acetoin/glycerol metabolism